MDFHMMALLASALCLTSCQSDSVRKADSSRQAGVRALSQFAQAQPERTKEENYVLVREWRYRDGNEYVDRNGDGMVDWEASGSARGTDGYGVYKEDNDYDGFYEREYMGGGFSYHIVYDKKIRQQVPQFHRIYPPTRVIKRPRDGTTS
jgi:hypothetical protein